MKNKKLYYFLLPITALTFLACGGGGGGSSDTSHTPVITKSISGQISNNVNPAPSLKKGYANIGNIEKIVSVILEDGEANLDQTISSPVSADGNFSAGIDDTQVSENSQLLLIMDTGSSNLEEKVAGLISLTTTDDGFIAFPADLIDANISLGSIYQQDGQTVSSNTLSDNIDSFSATENFLNVLAQLDDSQKIAVNDYINYYPSSAERHISGISYTYHLQMSNIENQYAPLINESNFTHIALGTHSYGTSFEKKVCSKEVLLEIIPPQPIVDKEGVTRTSYSNANAVFWDETSTSYNCIDEAGRIHFGERYAGGLSTHIWDLNQSSLVSGFWKLNVDGETQAIFDFSLGSVYDEDGEFNMLVPSPKVNVDQDNKITTIDMKYYRHTVGGTYVEETNATVIERSLYRAWAFMVTQDLSEFDLVKVDTFTYTLPEGKTVYNYGTTTEAENMLESIWFYADANSNVSIAISVDENAN